MLFIQTYVYTLIAQHFLIIRKNLNAHWLIINTTFSMLSPEEIIMIITEIYLRHTTDILILSMYLHCMYLYLQAEKEF